ncbi:hypothetical protein EJ02DRAFT_422775 [Clathrospora elynae]|uniref:Uncharacterized protein n=1 Tax=Clathrospora elynae TaxID=706981 RepID=A0A6A5SNL5_9PLEO|nr:hypothetical protein EJ02DRAFT_422775 [Clathrospora elynae]
MPTRRERNVTFDRMANVGGSSTPFPEAGEHAWYPNVTCFVHVYAPTTVHTATAKASPETRVEAESSSESDSGRPRRASSARTSNLGVIDLESLDRRPSGKRQAFLEWLITQLQKLLGKVT